MPKHILFFHGSGSEEGHDTDAALAASLKSKLGASYSIHYPVLTDDGTPDLGRRQQISREIAASEDGVILVGHSFGASMLLACLSEMEIRKKIAGIFLMGTPFWSGDEDWVQAYKLQPDFAKKLNPKIPLFLYHCRDDEEVPFAQLTIYKRQLPWASIREIPVGGHQLNNDLTLVANDIRSL